MKCPFCGEADTKVIDSRPADENTSIRRRRQCDKCNKRFTTYEKVESIPLVVIKKDQTREPYDRAKIERGVFRSCHKLPISVDDMNLLVDKVETEIFNKEINAVAYVRFASIYREFKDVDTFMEELKKILDK